MSKMKALSVAAMIAIAAPAFAQDDSSSDVAAGYPSAVVESEAVVIRVPVDAFGVENTAAAEMRVTAAADESTGVEDVFATGIEVVDEALFDADADSSTSYGYYGCGWSNYRNYGHGSYYGSYNYYQPSYTYYTNTWNYSYSYTRTSYSYGSSYNYYYYPRSYRTCGGSYSHWNSYYY